MKPYAMRIASISMFSFITGVIYSQIGQEQPMVEAYIFTWGKALFISAILVGFYLSGFLAGRESMKV